MALENLKQNIETEKKIVKEIFLFSSQLDKLGGSEKRVMTKTLNSLIKQMIIINNSVPEILNSISVFRNLAGEEKAKGLIKLSVLKSIGEEKTEVTLKERDKEKFLEELRLSEETLTRLKHVGKVKKEEFVELKRKNIYAKISNKLFLWLSNFLVEKDYFASLNSDLRKANISFFLPTYVSMAFFTTFLAFLFGISIFAFLSFFSPSLTNVWVIFALPLFSFVSFYFYPYAESKGIETNINHEIPFVVIHMSAISSSGIEPTQIFKIIALGEEYPYMKTEIKKIVNQVNVYGYDLVTALKNVARETSSKKFAELLNGMAATISGGSSLTEFFDKRAETLLLEYKLNREKYTRSAETFMDIYISIMIAAPMILTLMLILMSISGMGIGISLPALTLIVILITSLINILFIIFLHLNQPAY